VRSRYNDLKGAATAIHDIDVVGCWATTMEFESGRRGYFRGGSTSEEGLRLLPVFSFASIYSQCSSVTLLQRPVGA